MLHALGAAEPLIAQGLKAPTFQYRTKKHGLLAEFDFAAIADATQHPYRLQCEQSKLTRILYEQMRGHPNFELRVRQRGHRRHARTPPASRSRSSATARPRQRSGRYLIGADGASSAVRRSLGIEFEGFTWPDRLLVVSTPFDFSQRHPGPRRR